MPFLYTFESLTLSLPSEKGHGKDSIRNILRLEDKPRTLLGHYNDIVRTSKRQKGQMRTIPGQTQDKPRTEKGLTKGRTDRKYNFTLNVILHHDTHHNLCSVSHWLYADHACYFSSRGEQFTYNKFFWLSAQKINKLHCYLDSWLTNCTYPVTQKYHF